MGKRTRLFLHVGTHKTATTAIQASLDLDRRTLTRDGILYPSHLPAYPREAFSHTAAHHRFAHSVSSESFCSAAVRRIFVRQVQRAGTHARAIVLSSEAIYRHLLPPELSRSAGSMDRHRAYLERLAGLLSGFDVVPIIYFRDPHAFAESIYKENLSKARNPMADFETFLARDRHVFRYSGHLDILRDVFGAVEIRKYEDEARDGIVAAFYNLIEAGIVPSTPKGRTRVSLSNRAARWLQRANIQIDDLRIERQIYAAMDPDGCFQEEGKSTLFADQGVMDAFRERYVESFSINGMGWPMHKEARPVDWCTERHSLADHMFREWLDQNGYFLKACRKRGIEAALMDLRTPGLRDGARR